MFERCFTPQEDSIAEAASPGAAVPDGPPRQDLAERVAQIRQQLRHGQYRVDLDLLAARIVEHEASPGRLDSARRAPARGGAERGRNRR
jgi:hypothetical protein